MIPRKVKILFLATVMVGFTGGYVSNVHGETNDEVISSNESIYIYSTHNRESYLSNPNEKASQHGVKLEKDNNITLVGDYLAKSLKEKDVNVIHTKEDYYATNEGNYKGLYKLSRKTVKGVLKENPNVKMTFDIQNTSLPREKTTIKINGQKAAKVYFIVDQKNPNWQENSDFANEINKTLEEMYPGVSGGIIEKKSIKGWNQDLHSQSLIINIGGKGNTFNEAYRTADMLANVVAELQK